MRIRMTRFVTFFKLRNHLHLVVSSLYLDAVATVIEESGTVMFAYSGFTGGSTNPVMPLINANNSGYVTGVQIQNIGSSDTDVTVTYTPSLLGTACSETQTVPAGQSATFALYAFNDGSFSDCTGGATFVGSAQVTGNTTSQPDSGIGHLKQ